jgi:hypothetical protein
MDGHRFDDLTRLLATGAPRRRVLGALSGGLAALFSERLPARAGCADEGGNCDSSPDCCDPLFCVAHACLAQDCLPPGEPCTANPTGNDLTCCANFVCVDGICEPEVVEPCASPGSPCDDIPVPCCAGSQCIDGFCTDPNNPCTPFEQPCDATTPPCCGDLPCTNGFCAPFVCSFEGEPCEIDADCCNDYSEDCINGVCTTVCVDSGGACETDADCCSSFAGYGCSDGICQDRCTGFDCFCCPGSWCVAEGDECASIECTDSGDCPTRAVGCHNGWCVDYEWWVCETTSDCDPGLECRQGVCQEPCALDGETCGETRICCGDLACQNGTCAPPCAADGDTCTSDADCCPGFLCGAGTCQAATGGDGSGPDDEPGGVTELPNTGVAPASGSGSFLPGASIIAAATAWLASKRLRPQNSQPETAEEMGSDRAER